MCESFNNWIVHVWAHPIISMLKGIRTKVYVRIRQNRSKAVKWLSRICPNILKNLNKYIDLAQQCATIWNDIERRTYSCRYWQLAGIPCAQAITVLFFSSKPAKDYTLDCYLVVEYYKISEHCLMPMEGMGQWPTDSRKLQNL